MSLLRFSKSLCVIQFNTCEQVCLCWPNSVVCLLTGWRWTQQNLWSWPNGNKSKHCKFDAEQPGTDSETGASQHAIVPKRCTLKQRKNIHKFTPTHVSNLSSQLSDAISIIGREDFPQKWPDLLTEMVTRFRSGDFHIINGVLRTAHSLFKR